MIFRSFARTLAITALVLAFPVEAQQEAETTAQLPCPACLTQAQARQDLATLFETLQREHVDLFARTGRAAYEAHLAQLSGSIDGPISRPDFNLVLQDAMSFGRIGHAKTEAALTNVFAHVGQGGTIIPLSIAYRGEAMITDNWVDRGDSLVPGSRILQLGGMGIAEFEARARRLVAADTDRLLRAQLETALPAYLFLVFGPRDSLDVEFVTPAGERMTRTVAAMGLGEMYALQDERALPGSGRNPQARISRDLGNGVFYLQPGPFFATDRERGDSGEAYAIGPYKAFVDEAFAALAASGAQDLVIDLRGNPGGDASFSDLVVARLVDRPYRFASRYEIRAGENTKRLWAERETGGEETLAGLIAASIARAKAGERVDVILPQTPPIAQDAFRGRVFALVDKHSYSNAAVVAALLQDLDIATLMGEETADLATTYGAVESFTLPHSGVSITYPKAYMVRPSGSEEVRGVVPDFLIAPNPVGAARDVMLDTAVTQIVLSR